MLAIEKVSSTLLQVGDAYLQVWQMGLPDLAPDGPVSSDKQNVSISKPLQAGTPSGQPGPSQQLHLSNASESGQAPI